jgi:hypothetical protein
MLQMPLLKYVLFQYKLDDLTMAPQRRRSQNRKAQQRYRDRNRTNTEEFENSLLRITQLEETVKNLEQAHATLREAHATLREEHTQLVYQAAFRETHLREELDQLKAIIYPAEPYFSSGTSFFPSSNIFSSTPLYSDSYMNLGAAAPPFNEAM